MEVIFHVSRLRKDFPVNGNIRSRDDVPIGLRAMSHPRAVVCPCCCTEWHWQPAIGCYAGRWEQAFTHRLLAFWPAYVAEHMLPVVAPGHGGE